MVLYKLFNCEPGWVDPVLYCESFLSKQAKEQSYIRHNENLYVLQMKIIFFLILLNIIAIYGMLILYSYVLCFIKYLLNCHCNINL